MRAKTFLLLGAMSPIVQGCAVYSFAPPHVDRAYVRWDQGESKPDCTFEIKQKGKHADNRDDPNKRVKHTIKGAGHLIDNYLMVYRCSARKVANGRQHFEVPALLVALGGATAAAFNAPAGVAIATGAAGGGLASAKGYYAPREKAPILAAAVDALTCVKSEAVGVDAYGSTVINQIAEDEDDKKNEESKKDKKAEGVGGAAAKSVVAPDLPPPLSAEARRGTEIAVDAADQYFAMVETALLSIENIAAQRLSSVGSFAPDALMSEITTLSAKIKADEEARKKAAEAKPNTGETPPIEQVGAEKILVASKEADGNRTPAPVVELKAVEGIDKPVAVTPAVKSLVETQPAKLEEFKALVKAQPAGRDFVVSADKEKLVARPINAKDEVAFTDKAEEKAAVAAISQALLRIPEMQPKLQLCVVRAKL